MLTHTSPYHAPDVFNWRKVWSHCWPSWHTIDVVLLKVSIEDSCTVSMGNVILKNKTSTHTTSKREDKGCQYVVSVTLLAQYGGRLSVIVIPPHTITDPLPNLLWNRIVTLACRSFRRRQTWPRLSRKSEVNTDSSENMTRDQRQILQFWVSLYHSRLWAMWRFVNVRTTQGRRAWRWAAWRRFLVVWPATRTPEAWWRFATIWFAVWDQFRRVWLWMNRSCTPVVALGRSERGRLSTF